VCYWSCELYVDRGVQGSIPLVVTVNSADIIASLLLLKREVEAARGTAMKMTLLSGTEAHLLAPELAAANVGVILAPPRSFPYTWEQRRMCVSISCLGLKNLTREQQSCGAAADGAEFRRVPRGAQRYCRLGPAGPLRPLLNVHLGRA
jgi:hypothetical protein